MLTNKQLQSFKPKDKEYIIADRDGLSIRIRTTGHMSWVFRYRYNAKAQKIVLGAYNQNTPDSGISLKKARITVSKYKSLLEEDNDPKQWIEEQLREKRQKKTVKEVIDEFIERVLMVNRKRPKQPIRMLNTDVLPIIGKRFIADISRKDILKVTDVMVNRGAKVGANRTVTLLKQLFDYAESREYIVSNPVLGLKAIHIGGKEISRDRVLDLSELTILLNSLSEWNTHQSNKLAVHFVLSCGQRIGAVFSAKWADIDFKERIWTIPASSEHYFTKSDEERKLPLSSLMIELLAKQREFSGNSEFVWPAVTNPLKVMIKDTLSSVIQRNNFGELDHWTAHDLRRTVVTHMAEMSIPFQVSEKIVGHKMAGVMAVYNRYNYLEEQRDALNQWAKRIDINNLLLVGN